MNIDKIKSKNILVIGDLMLDIYLRGKANRISPEAPVPIVLAEGRDFIPGGSANVMANLSALGCKVTGVGFVGNDEEGHFLVNKLESLKINTESIIVSKQLSTIHKTRVLADGQHVVRFDFDTDFSKVHQNERLELIGYIASIASTKSFDAVVISDYCKGTIDESLMLEVKEIFSCPIVVDTKPKHKVFFTNVHCITPNVEEAKQMTHGHNGDHFKVARTLKKEMSLRSIIITLADKGILLIDENNEEILYDAYTQVDDDPTQRFDVTGAGDTVISVFTACLAAGIKTKDAVYVANVAAGIVVSKIGTAACSYGELVHELHKEDHDESGST